MKTAMQELLDDIQKYIKVDWPMNKSIRNSINKALEKEKEQIIDAMERTAMYVSAASLDKEIGKMTIEDLYNQTYNQDK
jgi:hypothetical protein